MLRPKYFFQPGFLLRGVLLPLAYHLAVRLIFQWL
jgi:hypothetical protein